MHIYTVALTEGLKAIVFNKRELKIRSRRILFLRIRSKKRFIAYSVETGNHEYNILKSKKEGKWVKIASRFGVAMNTTEQKELETIKRAIDDYEMQFGETGYLQLF